MLFNSIDFALFLPIVFICYWAIPNKQVSFQNAILVMASYLFYGWWDWRFLFLIGFSTLADYSIGILLAKQHTVLLRKLLLWTSICLNLGLLGFFKYYHFFLENFSTAFSFLGTKINTSTLNIILPVGISFYTFQTLSYTIDVYRKKLEPTKNVIAFSAFVSFFPQLVAGPIERATNLLPQFHTKRIFNYSKAIDGLRQILWGILKKVVIADNCAEFANQIFNNSSELNASSLILGAFFFTFQIYGDFSGYSDIVIGTSRLFGFNLMKNFAFPYFSRDVGEFWRRWHISLSTWFRDYVYIPLGGSKGSKLQQIRNTFIIFLVSGFWHGANWTFVIWGGLNALYFLPLLLTKNNRNHIEIVAKNKLFPNFKEFFSILATFGLTVFAWIFFRAETISHALKYISGIWSPSLFKAPNFNEIPKALVLLLIIGIFMLVEWIGRQNEYAIEKIGLTWRRPLRWSFYALIIFVIGMFMQTEETPFIYFQF
ncbi:MBOAT family O-acyltransferase [Aquimarina agarilytica]|uniref:MBOAT family O-acyltransferase n=1 Tax=Aquimarina agarilytica TaxID=1087449 RepID=UPI000289AD76|nr:MBOAT family O-acyltransferase [Aquimarina agarilytica]